jgi:uncharacterized protein YcbX
MVDREVVRPCNRCAETQQACLTDTKEALCSIGDELRTPAAGVGAF